MAVTLIVEDGSIVAGANSYITLVEADDYAEMRGNTTAWDALTDDLKNARIAYATKVVDEYFVWEGYRTSSEQVLEWPRSGAPDCGGQIIGQSALSGRRAYGTVYLDSNVIPQELKDAVAEMAIELAASDRVSAPALATDRGDLKSLGIFQGVNLEWYEGGDRANPITPAVERFVSCWGSLKGGGFSAAKLSRS